ncbi:MAG: GntR family transcriptional regulator [Acidaminococcales bacterium]|jgi:DNA-binding GntR family transcriptional regulator|nr:GntR family transcriptional regulator [Acidaminococcales bacterium]
MTKYRLRPVDLNTYRPLREIVCESLRTAIIGGVLKPGERLMEIQLAEELGVSRTPIREAIRKLEQEGFIDMLPRRGAYVANISIKDVVDVYEIRIALDVLAAGLAAERITGDELALLRQRLGIIKEVVEHGDMEKIGEYDWAFHEVLYKAGKNDRLVGIINNLRDQLTRLRVTSMNYQDRIKDTMLEHELLVESIAMREPELAKQRALEHMRNAERTLLKAIEAARANS